MRIYFEMLLQHKIKIIIIFCHLYNNRQNIHFVLYLWMRHSPANQQKQSQSDPFNPSKSIKYHKPANSSNTPWTTWDWQHDQHQPRKSPEFNLLSHIVTASFQQEIIVGTTWNKDNHHHHHAIKGCTSLFCLISWAHLYTKQALKFDKHSMKIVQEIAKALCPAYGS